MTVQQEDVDKYARTIGMTFRFSDRLVALYQDVVALTPDTINDIFVSESVNSDGVREYLHLGFFSQGNIFWYDGFLTQENLFIVPLSRLTRLVTYKRDYRYKEATATSRLTVDVLIDVGGGFNISLRATGENCAHLLKVAQRHLLPRLA